MHQARKGGDEMMLSRSKVVYRDEEHDYHLDGVLLSGVTPIVNWMYPKTYDGISDAVLAKAADWGSLVHKSIELYDTMGIIPNGDGVEDYVQDYINLKSEIGFNVLESEWLVDDGANIASSIDKVMEIGGEVWIGDIKTTSSLHKENVRLQLSIYAYLLKLNNPGLVVGGMAAIWLPKHQYGKPKWVAFEPIADDMVKDIITAYLAGADPTPYRDALSNPVSVVGNNLPLDIAQYEAQIAQWSRLAKDYTDKIDALKDGLMGLMKKQGITKYDGKLISLTYKMGGIRTTFDSKRFQNECPDIYAQYLKESAYKESLTLKIK